jgi:uncharacterized protein (DUF433 family)
MALQMQGGRKLLNAGIYDLGEVAHLARMDDDTVARWVTRGNPLLELENPPLFTFADLISLYVMHELRLRGVPLEELRHGSEWLSQTLKTKRPFAHKRLATVGRSFFAAVIEADPHWLDAGKGGRDAFQSVIEPLLRPIEYGSDKMAAIWFPHPGVWVNPRVQAGSPCIAGTRIPTSLIASLIEQNEEVEDVGDEYGLASTQVQAALDFEEQWLGRHG